MVFKKILSLNVFGIHLFKLITRIRLLIYRFTGNKSNPYFYYKKTKKLIKDHLDSNSNCIDVGASKGDILDIILKVSPKGHHIAIEPIPVFYRFLKKFYRAKDARVLHGVALDTNGTVPFYFQTDEPALSGYSKVNKRLSRTHTLEVPAITLDSIVQGHLSYNLIKLDCIGSELLVLKGAVNILSKDSPLLIFDFVKAYYQESMADELYCLLSEHAYKVFDLTEYPKRKELNNHTFKAAVFEQNKSHFFAMPF